MIEWLLLALILVLVAANAVFVASQFSLVIIDRDVVDRDVVDRDVVDRDVVDRDVVEQSAANGDRKSSHVLSALRDLSSQLSAAHVGTTITTLSIGYIAEPSLGSLVRGPLESAGISSTASRGISFAIAFLFATGMQMIFGELVPKYLATAKPKAVARTIAQPQRCLTLLVKPLVIVVNGSSNRILQKLGVDHHEEVHSARSTKELASLVARSRVRGTLDATTSTLLTRSLAFTGRTAADVMTPRRRVQTINESAPVDDVIKAVFSRGHSRFPVIGRSPDDVLGIVHLKHAVAVPVEERRQRTVSEIMVIPVVLPVSVHLDPLLARLRHTGLQMAILIDEYGGMEGIVTLEDLVEEIVGEIADEFDRSSARARQHRDGSWSLSGTLRPDEVTEITGVYIPQSHEYDTFGGFVLDEFGRVPVAGQAVIHSMINAVMLLTVERMDGLRIDRVRLEVKQATGTTTEYNEV